MSDGGKMVIAFICELIWVLFVVVTIPVWAPFYIFSRLDEVINI